MRSRFVSGGLALLIGVFSYIYSRFDLLLESGLPSQGPKNSIFGLVVSSFFQPPLSPLFIAKQPFGILSSNQIGANQSIMYFSDDSTHFILDGSSNVPFQLQSLSEFESLSHETRVTLSIALHKVMSDEFPGPLSLLWKAVGVRPLPDVRSVRYRGLFSFDQEKSGIEELDRLITSGTRIVQECLEFLRANSRSLPSALGEPEIRWSWIFLNLYGINVGHSKVLIAPLVFARRSLNTTKTVLVRRESEGISILNRLKLERGDEIFVDGSKEFSDSFAFAFHGSWVGDESLHRGRFWLKLAENEPGRRQHLIANNCSDIEGLLEIWLSNDERELVATRARVNRCVRIYISNGSANATLSTGRELRILALTEKLFKKELELLYRPSNQEDVFAAIRFQYFNLLYNEVVYWRDRRNKFLAKTVEV
jgi:hypothetical protein